MDAKHKTPDDAKAFIRAVAEKNGWVINPEDDFVGQIAKGLAVNYNTYGYYLCPCRDGDGAREADQDIICPCEYLRADHEEYGHCLCGLFLSSRFAATGQEPRSIPERRPGGI
jgi:ferredoxin-thioredoxin reductase catalytic chain